MILDRLLDLEKAPAARGYSSVEYNLDRYRALLEALGNPQEGLAFLHVAGTKGKGSTCAMAEAMLLGLGHPTAFYSSPHLEHFGERFRLDGEALTPGEFETALERFFDRLPPETRRTFEGPHSYRTVFETLTALALIEFRSHRDTARAGGRKPQAVCWETGLGGRLDCTNVVDPLVTGITALGMDHCRLLGDRIELIAAEKAGIVKPGRPVIVGRQKPEHAEAVWPVLLSRAAEMGAPLVRAWEHNPVVASRDVPEGQVIRVRLPDGNEAEGLLPLRGGFQHGNLEVAVALCWYAVRELEGRAPSGEALLAGLARTRWPARFEVLERPGRPALVLDGAHCPLSAEALGRTAAQWLADRGEERIILLWAMQKDKDHAGFLRALRKGLGEGVRIDKAVTCPVVGVRGATPEELAARAREAGLEAEAAPDAAEAVRLAEVMGAPVLAAGTLYTPADLRNAALAAGEEPPAGDARQRL